MAKIKHIAIATQEPEKTANFYKQVFDLQEVGRVNSENAEGYYLSDGHINLAILRFKNDEAAGDRFGAKYSGLHHIGFQVDDLSVADARLRRANSYPLGKPNNGLHGGTGRPRRGRNVELKYCGPDGVVIDISQGGWVGTSPD